MDFTPADDSAELTGLVRDMSAQLVTTESLAALDSRFGPGTESGGHERETVRLHERLWTELVQAGVPAALGPASTGGAGLGTVGEALAMRELGRVLAPVPLSSAIRAARLLDEGGELDRARDVVDGQVIAGVSDSTIPSARTHDDGGTGLGEVDWAPIADLVLAPSDRDGESVELYVLDAGVGFECQRTIPVDYSCAGLVQATLRAETPGHPALDVTADAVATDRLRRRVHLAAYQWGVLEAALEHTVDYASSREQFGRKIGTFQAVSARLADGHIDVDAVRLSTLRAAYELDAGGAGGSPTPAARNAVAAAHFWACEVAHRVAHTAVHVHGGVGLDREHRLHRYFLAAKAGEFRLGGATMQLIDLGSELVDTGDPWA